MFLYINGKMIIALFATCPNCGSSDIREISSYDGYTHYKCNECSNEWTD
jgi:transposase-like protein